MTSLDVCGTVTVFRHVAVSGGQDVKTQLLSLQMLFSTWSPFILSPAFAGGRVFDRNLHALKCIRLGRCFTEH